MNTYTVLSAREIAELFQQIRFHLESESPRMIDKLLEMQPKQHETRDLLWRSRLFGFVEGLYVTNTIHKTLYERIERTLFSGNISNLEQRGNRRRAFNIDVITTEGQTFSFNVPATNPNDAYAQLSKRIVYRSINNIDSVIVYDGLYDQREEHAEPAKKYTSKELICA